MEEAFSRTARLLGEQATALLSRSRVAVFGIGGVGGYAVEALARAGIGALELIDRDTVSISNINRQILATVDTVGRDKVTVAAERIASINPACRVTPRKLLYLPDTAAQVDLSGMDYVVDAIDTVTGKLTIIEQAKAAGVPVISCMGTGNKLDATAFRVSDISRTVGCPLARIMRKELKRRGITDVKVVWSPELPLVPADGEGGDDARRALPGTVSFVPPVAGMILAGEVIKDLLSRNAPPTGW